MPTVQSRFAHLLTDQMREIWEKGPSMASSPEFHPMPGKIVVDLITDEEIGGIIIPAQYQQSRVIGTIRALGVDEEEGDFYDLAVGDTVLFGRNSGVEVTVDRVKVLVLRTNEILCKVTWP